MHQLVVLSTGWAVVFYSTLDGVHHNPFIFVVDHYIFFWFLTTFHLDLMSHIASLFTFVPIFISITPTLVPYLLSLIDITTQ